MGVRGYTWKPDVQVFSHFGSSYVANKKPRNVTIAGGDNTVYSMRCVSLRIFTLGTGR